MARIPAPDWKYIRDRLGHMSFDELKELKPQDYGFQRVGDLLTFLVVEEHGTEFRDLYSKAEPRIKDAVDRRSGFRRVYEAVLEGEDWTTPEHEEQVNELVVTELRGVIQDVTDYWRKNDKL